LTQDRDLLLRGCGLLDGDAAPWTDKPAWHILGTAFGCGLNFLATWHAWRNAPRRPGLLHFSSLQECAVSADDIRNSAAPYPELAGLASQLAEQWRGMLPGVHRLVLDGSLVQLTLHIGPLQELLPTLDATVDSVFLCDADSGANPDIWSAPRVKAVARLCRPGTQLASGWVAPAVQNHLASAGFELAETQGQSSERNQLRARYAPRWAMRAVAR